MEIAAEERVNMSLDDLIKAQQKKKPAVAGNNGGRAKTGNAGQQRKKRGMNAAAAAGDKNVVQAIGQTKAKRAANVNQRRGLNTTGRPSRSDINNAVNQQTNQYRKRGGGAVRGRGGGFARPIPAAGLKISFNPNLLAKTTDRTVSSQIKAALSKQGSGARKERSGSVLMTGSTTRQVNVTTGGRGRGRGGGRGGRNRGGVIRKG